MAIICHTWLPWYSKSKELFEHVSDLHLCSTCFCEFADLTQHKKKCQTLQFQCCFCYALFATYKHLNNHVRNYHLCNLCEECNACFETEDELDQHVWQIHQFKTVKYVFLGAFLGFLGCVFGGILEGYLGGILGGTLGGIFGADFFGFAREEDLNHHERIFIPMHEFFQDEFFQDSKKATGKEWKPQKAKKERKKRNRKRRR